MQYKVARHELESYRHINSRITALMNERERVLARAEHMTSDIVLREVVGGQSLMTELWDKLAQFGLELDKHLKALKGQRKRIEDRLFWIADPYKTVLYLRYIQSYTLEKIAVEMNYSYQHIKRLCNKGLGLFTETDELLATS